MFGLKRTLVFLNISMLLFSSNCKPPDLNHPCDPKTLGLTLSLIVKAVTNDPTTFCGIPGFGLRQTENPGIGITRLAGKVQGLGYSSTLIIKNNREEEKTILANGDFEYDVGLNLGDTYTLTVSSQPNTQTCSVNKPEGILTENLKNELIINCELLPFSLWKPNPGNNYRISLDGRKLYVGGSFTFVTPPTGGVGAIAKATEALTSPSKCNYFRVYAVSGGLDITSIVSDGEGGVFIAGEFGTILGQTRTNIARIKSDCTLHSWNASTNAKIESMVLSDGKLFIGGNFTTVNGITKNYLAALSPSDGSIISSFNPTVGNKIWQLTVNNGYLYAAGNFPSINGTTVNGLGRFIVSTLSFDSSWAPVVSGASFLFGVMVSNGKAYVRGTFTTINGNARLNLACIDIATQTVTAWNPNITGTSLSTAVIYGDTMYLSGSFTAIGGQSRINIGAVDVSTGLVTSWNPPNSTSESIYYLGVTADTVYVSGPFTTLNGQVRNNLAAYNRTTAEMKSFALNINSMFTTAFEWGDIILFGGTFDSFGYVERIGAAAIDLDSGVPLPWNAKFSSGATIQKMYQYERRLIVSGLFTSVDSNTRNNIAEFDLDTGNLTSWAPNLDQPASAIVANTDSIFIGGTFTTVNSTSRVRIAELDRSNGSLRGWYPTGGASNSVLDIGIYDNRLYASGAFTNIGGQSRNLIAAFDVGNSSPTSLSLSSTTGSNIGQTLLIGDTLYVAGIFSNINGSPRTNLFSIDKNLSTVSSFNANLVGNVNHLVHDESKNQLYIVGSISSIMGSTRQGLARVNLSDQSLDTFQPTFDNVVNQVIPFGNQLIVVGNFNAVNSTYDARGLALIDASSGAWKN